MKKLTQIEGIGASYSQRLQQAGVGTLDRLLENDYVTEMFPTISECKQGGKIIKRILLLLGMAALMVFAGCEKSEQ